MKYQAEPASTCLISRRTMFSAAAITALIWPATTFGAASLPAARAVIPGRDDESETVRMAAEYYRRKYPHESTVDALQRRLGLFAPGDMATQAASLQQRIEADFAGQDIELVSGWMFARTELRLCLLTTLLGEAR